MTFYVDTRSTVPDLAGALKLALGVREQRQERAERRDEKIRAEAEQRELAGIAGGFTGGLNDALKNPEQQKLLTRMYQLDPKMAQFTVGLLEARDANSLKATTEEMNKSGAFFQGVLTLKPEERRDALLAKASELKDAGQPYEQVLEMAGQDSTQQEIGIRRKLVLNGQFQALAGPSLKEQLDLQAKQLDQLKTWQQMQLDAEKNQRDADAAARAAEKAAADAADKEAKKQASLQSLIGSTEFVAEQLNLADKQLGNAWSGWPGKIASNLALTGDTAALRRTLDTITSRIGFGELMRMKAESPTGGALGAVSEKELALLNATLGNLDALQSDEDLRRVLKQVWSVYDRVNRGAGGSGLPPLGSAAPAKGGPPAPPASTGAPSSSSTSSGSSSSSSSSASSSSGGARIDELANKYAPR